MNDDGMADAADILTSTKSLFAQPSPTLNGTPFWCLPFVSGLFMSFAQFSVKPLIAYYLTENLCFEYGLTLHCRHVLPTCHSSPRPLWHQVPYKNFNTSYSLIYPSLVAPGTVTDLEALPEVRLFPGYDGLQTTVTAREGATPGVRSPRRASRHTWGRVGGRAATAGTIKAPSVLGRLEQSPR